MSNTSQPENNANADVTSPKPTTSNCESTSTAASEDALKKSSNAVAGSEEIVKKDEVVKGLGDKTDGLA